MEYVRDEQAWDVLKGFSKADIDEMKRISNNPNEFRLGITGGGRSAPVLIPCSKRIPPKGRDKDEAILMNISNRLQYLNKNISDVGRAQNIIKETVEYIGHYLQNKRIESGKESSSNL